MAGLPARAKDSSSSWPTPAPCRSSAVISSSATEILLVIFRRFSSDAQAAWSRASTSAPNSRCGLARPAKARRSPVSRSTRDAARVVVPMSTAMARRSADLNAVPAFRYDLSDRDGETAAFAGGAEKGVGGVGRQGDQQPPRSLRVEQGIRSSAGSAVGSAFRDGRASSRNRA